MFKKEKNQWQNYKAYYNKNINTPFNPYIDYTKK